MMELIMPWELAVWLGAELPETVKEHRAMRRDGGHLLVRARETSLALYWRIDNELIVRSS